jgi:hypothetical protein
MVTIMKRLDGRLHNMPWRFEVWLADAKINDIPAFLCQDLGPR